ncbi:uncharacterized protein FA14DRAFT_79267 [Meira miltonrushii]|uniref:Uncharacterized protein n=1 Tax=Meira miltonrushii TaxID=1280837 RepID=A0A316V8V6_9BASI|nr:uncharacterized protein FA14DRAFT_79267 [Meira miltonrushii]PWN32901.1 hypothetical protein FA14DRAFT_79267 [Meira miltonrushii]
MVGIDYTQAGWTREQEVTNALESLYGREAKTMSHASTSSKTTKNGYHHGTLDGIPGKRQSKRKDLMDALRNFKKEQEQQHHHKQSHHHHHKSSSSASSSVTGMASKSGGSVASSSTTHRSESHRALAALNEKKQLEKKLSQQFQQLASESIEKENMMHDSNAFFDNTKARRSTVSSSKTRQRPTSPSVPFNHGRTKSLLMQSTNFLRGANSTSLPTRPEYIEHERMASIPSDYSEPRSNSQSHLSIPTAPRQGRLSNEGNSRPSYEQDMQSALTYPNRGRASTSDEPRLSQDQYRQPSLYKSVSARKRSYTLADVNAGSKSPSFDEQLSNKHFQEPEVQHEILALPFGWTAEQDTGRLSDEFLTSVSHEDEGVEEDGEGMECLSADLLLPSSMASRNTYSSSRRSSAARRYASLFKNNRSEESLLSIARLDLGSEDHHSTNEHNSASDRTSKRDSVKHEKVTPLPPRRQARRARVQSTCDAKKETRMAINAVKNAQEVETSSKGLVRPSMTDRRPTYHTTTAAPLEVKRLQRRISESSLSSAKTFFPLHDVSIDSQETRTNNKRLSIEDTNALGIQSLAHQSETSLHSSSSRDNYHQRQDSISSTLPSLPSDQHMFSSGDEDETIDPTRVSISSTSSFVSSASGTNASHSTDGTSSREGPIGPIIVQPTRRSIKSQHLYIPDPVPIDKRLSQLSSPTSFASANSEVWGSCYSSTNSSDAITTKQFGAGDQTASARTSRRPSTATGSESGANVPPVPTLPEKYNAFYRGGKMTSNPQLQQKPSLRRFGSEMHVNTYESQSSAKGSYDDMALHSSVMKRSYTSPVMDRNDGSQDDDEGSICLETPTFGYVASFVTAANSTPRAQSGSMFQTPQWTSPHYSPSLAQPSMNGALDSRFTRPQFNVPAATRNSHIYGTLDPRLGIYRNPVSPKTKSTSDDEDEGEEEERKEKIISDWRANIEAMRKEQNKAVQNRFSHAANPSFGLGLSHVKMALAEQTHTLTKVKDIQAEQELLRSRPNAHRSSISQVMQNRRNSLRLNATKPRN